MNDIYNHDKKIITLNLDKIIIESLSSKLLPLKPKRWGRMDILSKFIILGCAQTLNEAKDELKPETGLLLATKYGSLDTDIKYAQTISTSINEASPILFGYTLPNIAISEAASLFNLRGSVYATYSNESSKEDMLISIIEKARLWLRSQNLTRSFIVCVVDFIDKNLQKQLTLNNSNQALFTWVV